MHEADDAYMGYTGTGKDELIIFLNELLEAERAGAWVTLESARAAGSGPIAELMQAIQRDEARWCAMLVGHIKALGETPSPKVGAFYGKAMVIADLAERITFLNRGQGCGAKAARVAAARPRRSTAPEPRRDAANAQGQYRPRERGCRPRPLRGYATLTRRRAAGAASVHSTARRARRRRSTGMPRRSEAAWFAPHRRRR